MLDRVEASVLRAADSTIEEVDKVSTNRTQFTSYLTSRLFGCIRGRDVCGMKMRRVPYSLTVVAADVRTRFHPKSSGLESQTSGAFSLIELIILHFTLQ